MGKNGMQNPRLGALTLLIVAAAATRLIPHPPNTTSVAALALFAGAYFSSRWLAFLVPLLALFASDLVLGVYPHMEVQYLSFAVIICIGFLLQRRRTFGPIAAAALASSVTFFVLTNLGVWAFDGMYPRTLPGLLSCFVAALPFFRNTLLGDVFYTAVLFGGFHILERHFPVLRAPVTLEAARPAASATST
jgi:hypothetical protein